MADPVSFTRPAAERIARAVRLVENGDRSSTGPEYDRPWNSTGGRGVQTVRMCRFTGSWAKGTLKTVTMAFPTNTPVTHVASNLFVNLSVDCGTRMAAIAKDGTAWYLIQAEC